MWFFVHRLRGGWLSWLSWRNFPAEDFVRSDRRRASLWQSLNKPMNVCDKIVQRPRFRGFISYVLLFFFGFNIGKNKLGWYGHKVSWFQAWSSSQAKGSYIMGLGDFNTCWLSWREPSGVAKCKMVARAISQPHMNIVWSAPTQKEIGVFRRKYVPF